MEDYLEFLKRYCTKHKVTKEEAETHMIVKIIKEMYLGKNV